MVDDEALERRTVWIEDFDPADREQPASEDLFFVRPGGRRAKWARSL